MTSKRCKGQLPIYIIIFCSYEDLVIYSLLRTFVLYLIFRSRKESDKKFDIKDTLDEESQEEGEDESYERNTEQYKVEKDQTFLAGYDESIKFKIEHGTCNDNFTFYDRKHNTMIPENINPGKILKEDTYHHYGSINEPAYPNLVDDIRADDNIKVYKNRISQFDKYNDVSCNNLVTR